MRANLPDIVTGDKWYKQLSEIATLDPGLIGEAVNLFFTLLNLNDNPERKQKLLDSIDEQIKFGKVELKKSEETIVDAVEDVKDKTDVVIEKVENTPEGFKEFVESKGLTVKTAYIVDGVGQTNEPDPNGAKSNNWYFDKNTNTFISY